MQLRWIVSFQMLVEMRIMAAEKKELKRQQQSAPTLTQLLPAAHLLQQLKPKAIEIGESSSYLSHGSKCLLSCDDLFKISEKTKKY